MSDYDASRDVPEYNQKLQACLSDRQNAYVSELGGWGQQLDMIYHDFDEWREKIRAIKEKYPKPEKVNDAGII